MTIEPTPSEPAAPIVLFDGECGLCHRSVRFIARRDRGLFRFAPLQSELGERLSTQCRPDAGRFDTLILVDNKRSYAFSSGALRIARRLRWPWPLLFIFIVIPWPLRDAIYKFVAKNRIKWFGTSELCELDNSNVADRLIQ